MISPLLLRSSRWVSFFVIKGIVAPVLQSIFVFQERLSQASGQGPRSGRRQDAEQRTTGWDPAERLLQDLRAQAPADQIADRERGESAILFEIGSEHRPCEANAGIGKRCLKRRRRQVDDRNRIADQRERSPHVLERFRALRDREVASLPARGGAQLREVDR
jgi:hypothetical protein